MVTPQNGGARGGLGPNNATVGLYERLDKKNWTLLKRTVAQVSQGPCGPFGTVYFSSTEKRTIFFVFYHKEIFFAFMNANTFPS